MRLPIALLLSGALGTGLSAKGQALPKKTEAVSTPPAVVYDNAPAGKRMIDQPPPVPPPPALPTIKVTRHDPPKVMLLHEPNKPAPPPPVKGNMPHSPKVIHAPEKPAPPPEKIKTEWIKTH